VAFGHTCGLGKLLVSLHSHSMHLFLVSLHSLPKLLLGSKFSPTNCDCSQLQNLDRSPSLHDTSHRLNNTEKDSHHKHKHSNPEREPLRLPPIIPPQLGQRPRLRLVKSPLEKDQSIGPVLELINLPLRAVQAVARPRAGVEAVSPQLALEPGIRLPEHWR